MELFNRIPITEFHRLNRKTSLEIIKYAYDLEEKLTQMENYEAGEKRKLYQVPKDCHAIVGDDGNVTVVNYKTGATVERFHLQDRMVAIFDRDSYTQRLKEAYQSYTKEIAEQARLEEPPQFTQEEKEIGPGAKDVQVSINPEYEKHMEKVIRDHWGLSDEIENDLQKQDEPGKKYDSGKSPLDLLPTYPLLEIAKVLDFGAKKYEKQNWRKGMSWSRLIGAALRHITAWNEGEDLDPETGLSPLAHASCCLLFLQEYQKINSGVDDRYKGV